MEKEFISYDLALRLKALGFDEPCFAYQTDGCKRSIQMKITNTKLDKQALNYRKNFKGILPVSVAIPIFSQAFKFLIPLQKDEFKVCLSEDGWYIYNLENEMYEQDALEKMIEIVEKYKV